jgi:alpha-1,6-mannosyltransferase
MLNCLILSWGQPSLERELRNKTRATDSHSRVPMKISSSGVRLVIAALFFMTGAACMAPYGDFAQKGAGWQFQIAVAIMAMGWLTSLTLYRIGGSAFWILAVALRLILLPMQPGADIHRYLWEGRIQTEGFDPYHNAPNADALHDLRGQNWLRVQFKDATAIYPPLTELGFRLLASVSQNALFFKVAFVGVDLLVCLLLSRRFGFARSLVYACNPLILYSFAGAAHFDSWFIFCLVAGWLLWENGAQNRAAALFGAATALKWVSLPILAWSLWQAVRKHKAVNALVTACIGALPFAISWAIVTRGDPVASPWPNEFVLYARSFDLVAAFLSWLWPNLYAQNVACLVPLALAGLFLLRSSSVTLFSERWLLALLVLSPMVHAWYFTWLIPFAVATRNAGSIVVSISAFAYFGVSGLLKIPSDAWISVFVQYG